MSHNHQWFAHSRERGEFITFATEAAARECVEGWLEQDRRDAAREWPDSRSIGGGGTNRCREFLMQLRERGGFGSLSAEEEKAAKQAIDEDGR